MVRVVSFTLSSWQRLTSFYKPTRSTASLRGRKKSLGTSDHLCLSRSNLNPRFMSFGVWYGVLRVGALLLRSSSHLTLLLTVHGKLLCEVNQIISHSFHVFLEHHCSIVQHLLIEFFELLLFIKLKLCQKLPAQNCSKRFRNLTLNSYWNISFYETFNRFNFVLFKVSLGCNTLQSSFKPM